MKRRWSTRQDVWDDLNAKFGFVIDLCADDDNAKCAHYYLRNGALDKIWDGHGWGWLNPPFGREIGTWLRKASESARPIVALVPTRTNAPWWHDIVLPRATEIRFARKKLPFVEPNGHKGVPFTGHALVIFNGKWRDGFVSPLPARGRNLLVTTWDWRSK